MLNPKPWYALTGPEGDVVLSTRVRLARNLAEHPFTARLTEEGKRRVAEEVRIAAQELAHLNWIEMDKVPRLQAASMAERRLISAQFAAQEPGTALLMQDDERMVLMLCEEDHLRLQALSPGLALEEAYARANEMDTILSRKLTYAFSDTLGYLTQCPTNLGTAMRASVLLHLPALAALDRVSSLGASISKLGLTIRGAFGEGSEAEGALYQLSNQVTLGITEAQALENLQAYALQFAAQERLARAELLASPKWENKLWRAYGICRYARMLESNDAITLLSLLRMGACGEVLPIALEAMNALMTEIQPATLCTTQSVTNSDERDKARATMIRNALDTQ
jgi:protein arginine kinase